MQKLAVIDYGSGNLRSVARALAEAARLTDTPCQIDVTDDPAVVNAADRIVLPGVGAFRDCMQGLTSRPGLLEALETVVIRQARPFLGICVGFQLMAERGIEFGTQPGLGWIAGETSKLTPHDPALKIPHMGWNAARAEQDCPLLSFRKGQAREFYFVHSFVVRPTNPDIALLTCDYGERFTAAIVSDNKAGVQFHPEKSQGAGLDFLGRFLSWTP